jgi:hypothetical protein
MAIWGGAGMGAVVIGWIVLAGWSGEVAGKRTQAQDTYAAYLRKYRPEAPGTGDPEAVAGKRLAELARTQEGHANDAARALVAQVPAEFTRAGDLDAAQNTLARTNTQLAQACERARVPAPRPLFTQLSDDADQRSFQLTRLWAWREVAQLLLDAGVKQIPDPTLAESRCGPADAKAKDGPPFARLGFELKLDVPWETAQRVLEDALAAHRRGFGLREVDCALNRDGSRSLRVVITALVPNQPGWKLEREALAPPAAGAAHDTTAPVRRTPPPASGRSDRL